MYFAEISLKLIGCHDIDDVREISVGLGLQLLRLVSSTQLPLATAEILHLSKNAVFVLWMW